MSTKKRISLLDKNGTALWIAIIFLIWIVWFWKYLVGMKYFFLRDITSLYYPYKFFIAFAMRHFTIPHWNPFLNCGEPALANPQYMFFYPFHYIYYIFMNPYFFQFQFVIHYLIGAIGFFYFIRYHLKDNGLAFVSSILYAFNGFALSHYLFQNLIVYPALLPWLLIGIRKVITMGRIRNILLLSFVVTCLCFAVEPYYIIFSALISSGYILFLIKNKIIHSNKGFLKLIISLVIAVLIASVQLIPSYELFRQSARHVKNNEDFYKMELLDPVSVIVGNLYGDFLHGEFRAFKQNKSLPFYLSFYFGGFAFLIFLYGLLALDRKNALLIMIAFILIILLCFGGLPVNVLKSFFPLLKMGRFSIKFFFLDYFVFSVVFAFGFKSLVDGFSFKRLLYALFILFAIFGILYGCLVNINRIETEIYGVVGLNINSYLVQILCRRLIKELAIFLVSIIFVLSVLRFCKKKWAILVTALVICANLYIGEPILYGISKDKFLYKPYYVKLFKKLGLRETERISSDIRFPSLFIKTKEYNPYFYSIEEAQDFDSSTFGIKEGILSSVARLTLPELERVKAHILQKKANINDLAALLQRSSVALFISPTYLRNNAFKLISIKPYLNTYHLYYYEIVNRMPIIYGAKKVKLVSKEKIPNEFFDLSSVRRGDALIQANSRNINIKPITRLEVLNVDENLNTCISYVKAKEKGFLVFNSAFFKGWRVYVDGTEKRLYRVNYLFQGCFIGKGIHVVKFEFVSPGWKIALFCFSFGITMVLLLVVLGKTKYFSFFEM